MQINDIQTPIVPRPQVQHTPKAGSNFSESFEASLAEAKLQGPVAGAGPQARQQTAARGSLLELGTVSPDKPTVSHLLIDHPQYGPDCWEIVHARINAAKPYTRIPAGTRVFFDPNSREITWEGGGQGSPGLDRAWSAAPPDHQQAADNLAAEPAAAFDSSPFVESTGLRKPSSPDPDYQNREQALISRAVDLAAARYELPRELINGVIKAESDYQPRAVSPAGAQGLMQLMPETARELGVKNPFDIQENIDGGSRYLKKMLHLFDGDVQKALAAYNAGPGTMQEHKGEIPYQETRLYVQRVLSFYRSKA